MMNLLVRTQLYLELKKESELQSLLRFRTEGCFFNDIPKCKSGMQKMTLKFKDNLKFR